MKNDLTYNEAFSQLEKLVARLEDGNIPLDKLSANVKQANELIAICEAKLRNIQAELDAANNTVKRAGGKK